MVTDEGLVMLPSSNPHDYLRVCSGDTALVPQQPASASIRAISPCPERPASPGLALLSWAETCPLASVMASGQSSASWSPSPSRKRRNLATWNIQHCWNM